MTSVQGVYPWSDVAWDLARAAGVDPDAVVAELDQLDQLDEDNWDRETVKRSGSSRCNNSSETGPCRERKCDSAL